MRVGRKLADFVEEDGAPVGELEAADAGRQCAGECTFDVPEQLALDEPGGDGGAVHLHERPVAARTAVVQGARDELLASTGLAMDQDSSVARRHARHRIEQGAQRRIAADDLVEIVLIADFLLQIDVLRLQPVAQTLEFLHRRPQRTLGPHALQLGAGARGEDLQHVDIVLRRFHRLGMQHGDVAEHFAGGIAHRHAEVAVGGDLLQPQVFRKGPLQAALGVANVALRDAQAGGAEKAVTETFAEARPFPVGK